jgi:hypothetical protein
MQYQSCTSARGWASSDSGPWAEEGGRIPICLSGVLSGVAPCEAGSSMSEEWTFFVDFANFQPYKAYRLV